MSIFPYRKWQSSLNRTKPKWNWGYLGYFIDGEFRVEIQGDVSRYYVRLPDNSYTELFHKGRVSPPDSSIDPVAAQNIVVSLGIDSEGDYCILGLGPNSRKPGPSIFGGGILLPVHHHVVNVTGDAGAPTSVETEGDPLLLTSGEGIATETIGIGIIQVSLSISSLPPGGVPTPSNIWIPGYSVSDNTQFYYTLSNILSLATATPTTRWEPLIFDDDIVIFDDDIVMVEVDL